MFKRRYFTAERAVDTLKIHYLHLELIFSFVLVGYHVKANRS